MNQSGQPRIAPIGLSPELFAAAFPFHIVVDRQFNVRGTGATVARICPDLLCGVELTEVLQLIRPEMAFTTGNIERNHDRFFLLEHRATKLQLRGGFVLHPEHDVFLFLGSPWFRSADELAKFNLGFEDFAIHDQVADSLQVYQASQLALADAKRLADKLTAQRTELRTANQRLQEQFRQNRTLALVASRTTNAVVLTDAQGRIEWVNEGFTRITEYTLSEVAGQTPGSLLQGPETDLATVQFMREQLSKGEGFSVEVVNYSKSGRKYWLGIEVQPIRNDAGQIINFMAIESDITERKEAAHILLEANALQRAMLQGAGYGIISTDAKGTIHTFNPAAERMLGYSAGEIIGTQTPEIFHDPLEVELRARELTAKLGRNISPGFEAFVAKSELGQPDQREWTYIRKDGTRFPVLLSVSTLFDERGRITGYLGVASDLTEIKKAEIALQQSETHLNNALLIAKAGHWEYDVATDTFTFNDNFYRIFRTTAEAVGGYRLTSEEYAVRFLLPEDAPLVAEETRKAIESTFTDYTRTLEHRFRYADGETGHLAVRIKIVRDAAGHVLKTYGVNQDITERKRDEEKLRATLTELERFNRIMMNREERVMELKREINEMCLALGQPPAYSSVADNQSRTH